MKVVNPLKLIVGMLAAITSAFIGSIFGDQGTYLGLALGTGISSAAAAIYEQMFVKVHGHLRLRFPFNSKTRRDQLLPHFSRKLLLRTILPSAALICAAGVGIVSFTELASGKTIHSITTGKADYGTTLGGSSTKSPTPVTTVSPTETTSSGSPTIGVTPSESSTSMIPPTDRSSTTPSSSPIVTPSTAISPTTIPTPQPLEGTPTP